MDRRYVGIDLHRRRSVIYAMDAEGDKVFCERIDNDALRLLEVVSETGDGAEVVIGIAPSAVREARELVRYRARLVQLRSGLKAQVHAVMAKEGVLPETSDMFGPKGQSLLDAMELGDAYQVRVESLRDLIDGYDREVAMSNEVSTSSFATTAAT